ncbi:MAG: DUF4386 domain-containing protein [Jiangellales bacterium]
MASRKETARIAGGLYLAYIVLTVFANATRDRLVVPREASTTAVNVVASAPLLRVSVVSDVLAGVLFLLTAWALYVLLKPVNPNVALLFVALNLAGVAVQCLNMLNFFAAWLTYALQFFLLPSANWVSSVTSVLGFIGEFSLMFWLLIMGAREPVPASV